MNLTAFNAAILTLAMLLGATLQAPIQSEDRASNNDTTPVATELPEVSLESSGGGEMNNETAEVQGHCLNYITGSPLGRNKDGCKTGKKIKPSVNHETAFGSQGGQDPDWMTCGLRRLPQANQRICYKTTVDQCGSEYRIYLNLRNEAGLQRQCPQESEELRTAMADGSERYLQSPRYGCRKGRGSGSLYNYRPNEFCLYNVSIPNCQSGFLVLESFSSNNQTLQAPQMDTSGNPVCKDYIQIFYGNSTKTEKFCGDDLTNQLPLRLRATQFMALFWTDPSTNDLETGFKLRAKCVQ